MENIYYNRCKECEYVYHCFGKEMGRKIQNNETNELQLSSDHCTDFYPEQKQ